MQKVQSSSDKPKVLKEGEPTDRIHIWLYAADIEWIDSHVDAVKRSKFIRLALRRVINAMRARAQSAGQHIEPDEVGGTRL